MAHQHVVGLDVAVHDTALVRIRQRVGYVMQNAQHIVHGQSRFAQQPGAKRLAVDVRHCEVQNAARLAGRENRYDVRVL